MPHFKNSSVSSQIWWNARFYIQTGVTGSLGIGNRLQAACRPPNGRYAAKVRRTVVATLSIVMLILDNTFLLALHYTWGLRLCRRNWSECRLPRTSLATRRRWEHVKQEEFTPMIWHFVYLVIWGKLYFRELGGLLHWIGWFYWWNYNELGGLF